MTRRFWADLLERAARTFVQAFAAALVASETSAGWSVWASAAVAGLASAASAVMAVLTKPIGDGSTASMITSPPAPAPPAPPPPPSPPAAQVVVVPEPEPEPEPVSMVGEPVRVPEV